ncbi:hypothetical protein JW758_03070 [Candidatus Peregrinibacteria bacterium]|nr:hypothetical protein [Candidatus Peregrinibacteria bacterium]
MLKGKLKCCDGKVGHIVLIVWLVFATLYVLYGEYNRLNNYVAARAYNAGISTAVTQIITESQKCQPVPVNVNELKASLVNLECLQQPEEAEGE